MIFWHFAFELCIYWLFIDLYILVAKFCCLVLRSQDTPHPAHKDQLVIILFQFVEYHMYKALLSPQSRYLPFQPTKTNFCYCFILELWRGNCRNDSASSPINTIFKYASLLKIMKFNFITQIWGIHQIFWKSVNLVKSIEASQHFKCSVQNKHIFQNTFYFQFDINFGNQIKLN